MEWRWRRHSAWQRSVRRDSRLAREVLPRRFRMTVRDADMTTLFLKLSRQTLLEQYWPRLRGCVESLTDEQVWWRPNQASNSIGNLILHLNGNVRQWLVASFNRQEDSRNRPAEFDQGRDSCFCAAGETGRNHTGSVRGAGSAHSGRFARTIRDSGLPRQRAGGCLSCRGALRNALRADTLYHQESMRCGPGLL